MCAPMFVSYMHTQGPGWLGKYSHCKVAKHIIFRQSVSYKLLKLLPRDVNDHKWWGFNMELIIYRTKTEMFGAICVLIERWMETFTDYINKRMSSVSISILLYVERWQFWAFSFRFDIESVRYWISSILNQFDFKSVRYWISSISNQFDIESVLYRIGSVSNQFKIESVPYKNFAIEGDLWSLTFLVIPTVVVALWRV